MRFHISSIKLDVSIEGWKNTVIIDDRDILPLQNLRLVAREHKKIDLEFAIMVAGIAHLIKLPVTLMNLNGGIISLEIPETATVSRDNYETIVKFSNLTFYLVDLTPVSKTGRIIPTGTVGPQPV